MKAILKRLYHMLRGSVHLPGIQIKDLRPIYCEQRPSNQTIADIFADGWFSAFPKELGVEAGEHKLFDPTIDGRVAWANRFLPGGIRGRSVLELGPFEAYHTWQLEKLGAHTITAIEASNLNYLKCLLVKEITGLQARFLHGDFGAYLAQCSESFDLVWASAVLYHQTEPIRFVQSLSKVTKAVFVHTHYYDQDAISTDPRAAAFFVSRHNLTRQFRDQRFVLHYRRYGHKAGAHFSGGAKAYSYWMERQDILTLFRLCGFAHVIEMDDADNPWGPVMGFLATKGEPSAQDQGTS